jgi:hypothetical protein
LRSARAEAMQAAKSNKPMGSTYNRLMGEWLRQQQITVKYVTKQTEDTAAPVSHQFHAKEIAAARDR